MTPETAFKIAVARGAYDQAAKAVRQYDGNLSSANLPGALRAIADFMGASKEYIKVLEDAL